MSAFLNSILWLLPYLLSGFSAPLIFKNIQNLNTAGHVAGALFVFAGVWSLFLAFKFHMPIPVKVFFLVTLLLQFIFWGWRFFNSLPLREAVLFGLSGSVWHGILTSLYLLGALVLLALEMMFFAK